MNPPLFKKFLLRTYLQDYVQFIIYKNFYVLRRKM